MRVCTEIKCTQLARGNSIDRCGKELLIYIHLAKIAKILERVFNFAKVPIKVSWNSYRQVTRIAFSHLQACNVQWYLCRNKGLFCNSSCEKRNAKTKQNCCQLWSNCWQFSLFRFVSFCRRSKRRLVQFRVAYTKRSKTEQRAYSLTSNSAKTDRQTVSLSVVLKTRLEIELKLKFAFF